MGPESSSHKVTITPNRWQMRRPSQSVDRSLTRPEAGGFSSQTVSTSASMTFSQGVFPLSMSAPRAGGGAPQAGCVGRLVFSRRHCVCDGSISRSPMRLRRVNSGCTAACAATCAAAATKTALKSIATRYQHLSAEIDALDEHRDQLVAEAAPALVAIKGVGTASPRLS
jgi:hypothetical protein